MSPRRQSIRIILTAAVVGVLTISATASSTALAAPPTPSARSNDPQSIDNLDASVLATMRQQEALQPAVQSIGAEHARSPKSGYAGMVFEGDGLSLYWKGELTPGMTRALAKARNSGTVRVKAAAFSEAELHRDVERIDAAIKRHSVSQIQSYGFKQDGSGLLVERLPAQAVTRITSARAKAGQRGPATVEQILAEAHVSAPVSISTATEEFAPLTYRYDDYDPWNGGGNFVTARGSEIHAACTIGFGVHVGTSQYTLTAGHCASEGDTLYQGTLGYREYMGGVAADIWQYDILLSFADGSSVIFDGGPTTSNTKRVNAWGYWAANELVCHSGAKTGTRCNLKQLYSLNVRVSQDTPDSDGDWGYQINGLIRTQQMNGYTAAQPGDSGGPVFTLSGTGVRAKGIISGGGGAYMNFQDWADVIREFNAYPNT